MGIELSWEVALFVVVAAQAAHARAALVATADKLQKVPREYLVTLSDSVTDVPALAALMQRQLRFNTTHVYRTALKGFALHIPDSLSESEVLQMLTNTSVVTSITPNLETRANVLLNGEPAGSERATGWARVPESVRARRGEPSEPRQWCTI